MKNKVLTFNLAIFIGFLFFFNFAEATVFKNANDLFISESETYDQNSYLLATQAKVEGIFNQDLFIISGNSNFEGVVNGDLFIFGGKVEVNGTVVGDLRVIGGEVIIKGQIQNDLLVVGGKVKIADQADIQGQSLFIGGETNLKTIFNHPVKVISAKTIIDNQINNAIEVTTQDFILSSGAKIKNGMTYYAPKKATEIPGSVISGNIYFNQISPLQDIGFVKRTVINFVSFWLILKFVTILLVAFILAYIFRFFTKKVVDLSLNSFAKSLLVGLLLVIIVPVIIAFLLVSLVASPIGFLILLLFIILIIIVPAISGIVVGFMLRRFFTKKDNIDINFTTIAIGVVTLTFVGFVPYVGDITKIIINLVAMGAVIRYLGTSIFGQSSLKNLLK